MSEHLQVLESAISGVGAWLGWSQPAAEVLDFEFGRVLLAELSELRPGHVSPATASRRRPEPTAAAT